MTQNTPTAVTRLATALTGSLQELDRRSRGNRGEVQRPGTPAPGMQFEPPVSAGSSSGPDGSKSPDDRAKRLYASGVADPAAARDQPRALKPSVSKPKTTASRQ